MFKVGNIKLNTPLLLAPMEDVTDIAFRRICKELGADIVYTEFVNAEGLTRNVKKTHEKAIINEFERPIGIQIYGERIEAMVESAKIVEEQNPDLIDINAGCWVRKIAERGAGAGLMRNPLYLEKMAKEIVNTVKKPVTVKTRIGWDSNSINILEIAKRLEGVGITGLTIHCRTKVQGHSGEPDWSWINKVKEIVQIPVVLNGGVMTAEDVVQAFDETNTDGVMIARGAIIHPWIFREAKELMNKGSIISQVTFIERIETALKHLKYSIESKENEKNAIIPFRKFYSGYMKGLYNASKIRQQLFQLNSFSEIEEILLNYKHELSQHYLL